MEKEWSAYISNGHNEVTHNDGKKHNVVNGTTIRNFHVDEECKTYTPFAKNGEIYIPTLISLDSNTKKIIYMIIPHDVIMEAVNYEH